MACGVVQSFLRLLRTEACVGAVLMPPDDVFEVAKVPSLVVQGPLVVEDGARRCAGRMLVKQDEPEGYVARAYPRLYHLDFDLIATAGDGAELLDLQEKVARFFQAHPVLPVGELGALNLTLLVPLGGLRRVNLSNLRQASGRCRIEDCPVYDEAVTEGKLIHTRVFEFREGVDETAVFNA